MLTLTDQQQTAFDLIVNTFESESVFLLYGCAGTGKSSMTRYICNYYIKNNLSICGISMTHKAKRVLDNFLNEKKILPITTYTVASFLGKLREHGYVGSKAYSNPTAKKFNNYTLFILDEVSMVQDSDLHFIVNYIKKNNKKLLILGDWMQIPSPSMGYVVVNNIVEKKNSFIFTDNSIKKFELTQIVRQGKDSPILELTAFVRDHIDVPFEIEQTGYKCIISGEDVYQKYLEYLIQFPTSCKIITYTNQSVKQHNNEVRKYLGYNEPLVINDMLTGYNNIGWPELIIENGRDYLVSKIKTTVTHTIDKFKGLSGYLADLITVDTKVKVPNMFFINVHDDNNYDFISELIIRAEAVNRKNSTKLDYLNYTALKYKVLFLEDLYKFNGEIYSEFDFKEAHPLLFTKVDDVIKDKQLVHSKLSEKINTTYNDIISLRLLDDKIIADSETLSNQWKIAEKDISYAYSQNAHRCQGSTYDVVFVDEHDFNILQDRYNYKLGMMERKIKEKNQLRYVAYSRSRDKLFIIKN